MDYYRLRKEVRLRLKGYLERRQELIREGHTPQPYEAFELRLKEEFGVTEKICRTILKDYLGEGAFEIKDGDIRKV